MDTYENKLALMRLMMELRQLQPMGIVGVLETRNLFANLFPEFAEVRDPELDELIERLAESMREDDEALAARLEAEDREPDDYMDQDELA